MSQGGKVIHKFCRRRRASQVARGLYLAPLADLDLRLESDHEADLVARGLYLALLLDLSLSVVLLLSRELLARILATFPQTLQEHLRSSIQMRLFTMLSVIPFNKMKTQKVPTPTLLDIPIPKMMS